MIILDLMTKKCGLDLGSHRIRRLNHFRMYDIIASSYISVIKIFSVSDAYAEHNSLKIS